MVTVAVMVLFAATPGEAQTVSMICVDGVHQKYPDAGSAWVVTALTKGDTTELRWQSTSGLFGTCTLGADGQMGEVVSTGRKEAASTDRIVLEEVVVFETYNITCASEDDGRAECEVKRGAIVELVEVHGESECVHEANWGHEGERIWVDKGCHGTFSVRPAGQPLQPLPVRPASTDLASTVSVPELRTLEGRAQQACLREVAGRGFDVTHYHGTRVEGSYIVVLVGVGSAPATGFMGAQQWTPKGDVTCRYDPSNDRAVIAR